MEITLGGTFHWIWTVVSGDRVVFLYLRGENQTPRERHDIGELFPRSVFNVDGFQFLENTLSYPRSVRIAHGPPSTCVVDQNSVRDWLPMPNIGFITHSLRFPGGKQTKTRFSSTPEHQVSSVGDSDTFRCCFGGVSIDNTGAEARSPAYPLPNDINLLVASPRVVFPLQWMESELAVTTHCQIFQGYNHERENCFHALYILAGSARDCGREEIPRRAEPSSERSAENRANFRSRLASRPAVRGCGTLLAVLII